jgi:hypothetical protein
MCAARWDPAWLTEPEKARGLAKDLCVHSLGWVRTFAVALSRWQIAGQSGADRSSRSAAVEDALMREVLAFGLYLLELQLDDLAPRQREAFLHRLRYECWSIDQKRIGRRQGRFRRLTGAAGKSSASAPDEWLPNLYRRQSEAGRVTREMFEKFCANTGLGSDVLVGQGKNLAALLFYIAIHGALTANGALVEAQVKPVLQVAQECRTWLERWAAGCFEAPHSGSHRLPGAAKQLERKPDGELHGA